MEDLRLLEKVEVAALLRLLHLLLSANLAKALAVWLLRLVDREHGATLFLTMVEGRVMDELNLWEFLA
eukprot:12455763-Alexandrium_andersonii.AAC.1